MYYITKKTSETGSKFKELESKIDIVINAEIELANKFGFEEWRGGYGMLRGGYSSLRFKSTPDTKVYKQVREGEWMPKLNTKKGKEIQKELDRCPRVSRHELNMCIGWDGFPFQNIGFNLNSDDYYGFIVDEDWGVKIPSDCEEITFTRFKEIFKKDEK